MCALFFCFVCVTQKNYLPFPFSTFPFAGVGWGEVEGEGLLDLEVVAPRDKDLTWTYAHTCREHAAARATVFVVPL